MKASAFTLAPVTKHRIYIASTIRATAIIGTRTNIVGAEGIIDTTTINITIEIITGTKLSAEQGSRTNNTSVDRSQLLWSASVSSHGDTRPGREI